MWPTFKIVNGRTRHPASQGSVERSNQGVEAMLRLLCKTGQLETINNSTSTGKTSRVLLVSDGKEAFSYSKACCAICGMESTGAYLCDTQYVEIR
ncbi:hypothetical protein TNCV_4237371 [Trichonephila clavipes]|nr:hypothetical protein TNCV_4237371 [Trichonephila clavipes]